MQDRSSDSGLRFFIGCIVSALTVFMDAGAFACIVVNDFALPGWTEEHGFALWVEWNGTAFLFDTGQGRALAANLERAGADPDRFQFVVISHGHNDHTGGLSSFYRHLSRPVRLYAAPGIGRRRWSLSPPVTQNAILCAEAEAAAVSPREISMPALSADLLGRLERRALFRSVGAFGEAAPGIFLTGPIPRRSGEDAGGAFFFDPEGNEPDTIPDEQAVVLSDGREGILIQGCCHAGMINTLEYCRKMFPRIPVRTVVGGLHLVHADTERLRRTADYLESSPVERIVPLHCTGRAGVEYLRRFWKSGVIDTHLAGEYLYL